MSVGEGGENVQLPDADLGALRAHGIEYPRPFVPAFIWCLLPGLGVLLSLSLFLTETSLMFIEILRS